MSGPTSTPTPSDPGDALARSAIYQALAIGLAPPDREDEAWSRVVSAEGWRRLRGALLELGVESPSDLEEAAFADLDHRYLSLFGHTARGRVSPYETEYGADANLFLQAHELADIGAFLAAFGLLLDIRAHERADHVRSECEMMAFLASKEGVAGRRLDRAMTDVAGRAQRTFLRDHLGRFAPALGAQLGRNDDGYYGALGMALRGFVEAECARVGVPAGPERVALRLLGEDPAPMACGSCRDPVCP